MKKVSAATLNINSSLEKKLRFYVEQIEKENTKHNLTRFSKTQLWEEGVLESIYILNNEISNAENKKILDIGTGAGFPSFPFGIFANLGKNLFLCDSRKKKIIFLKKTIQKLNLNFSLIPQRIEQFKKIKYFDIILARAVAPLKKLIPLAYKYGTTRCKYIFIKGPKIFKEVEEAKEIIKTYKINYSIKPYFINNKKNYVFKFVRN